MKKYLSLISTLGWIYSVVSSDGLIGTAIDDKLAGYLSLGKTIVVTGWYCVSFFSIVSLVTIITGAIVSTAVTEAIGDGFLGKK